MSEAQLQHYLPCVYQKGFAEVSGRVWRFDRTDRSCKLIPIPVTGAEKNLYATHGPEGLSNELETKWFGPIDSPFGPILKKLENGDALSDGETINLASFIGALQIRTPASIRECELRIKQFEAQIGDRHDPNIKYHAEEPDHHLSDKFVLTTEEVGAVSTFRAESSIRNEALTALIAAGDMVGRAILGMEWCLFKAPLGRSFIVSDCPFTVIPPRSHVIEDSGVGVMTPGAVAFVPLSAKICVRFSNKRDHQVIRRQSDGAMVRSLNMCQVLNSERFIFSQSEQLIRNLTAGISACGTNVATVVTREAGSVSRPDSSLLHTFTRSKIGPEWADRVPQD